MNFVLDASVALAWCFEEAESRQAEKILARLTTADARALVPSLWQLEVVNVFRMAEKRRTVTPRETSAYLGLFASLPIEVSPRSATPAQILDLARRHDLTAYDAAYLDLALCMGLPLATLDRNLSKAARASGVESV